MNKWTIDKLFDLAMKYFETEEGINYPTRLGLFCFIGLSDNTYEGWQRKPSFHTQQLLKIINTSDRLIKKHHLKKILQNPENSKWYLERAYFQEFNLTKVEKIMIENNTPTDQIKIILNNKGKNKIE